MGGVTAPAAAARVAGAMKIFHVSDVHFGAEDPDAIAWFNACVADERPDAVIMTGDLTMRALPREFQQAGDWLAALPAPVTVEVGNHDIPYYSDPLRRLFMPYRRYLRLEAMIERPLTLPGVTVVPLRTTARWQWRIDQSKGRVSRHSLAEALERIAAAPAGNLILIAAHHPLLDPGDPTGSSTGGGAAALDALARAGAHAVLSGHVHFPFDLPVARAGRELRMVGAGTLSKRLRHSPPAFNELRVTGEGRLEVMARLMEAGEGTRHDGQATSLERRPMGKPQERT